MDKAIETVKALENEIVAQTPGQLTDSEAAILAILRSAMRGGKTARGAIKMVAKMARCSEAEVYALATR